MHGSIVSFGELLEIGTLILNQTMSYLPAIPLIEISISETFPY
jgi:hypothetical protein